MADTPPGTPADPAADTEQDGSQESPPNGGPPVSSFPIMVNAQYVKDLSFENPRAPDSLMVVKEQPEINVDVNVNARTLQENAFEVTLSIRVEAKVADEVAFLADLVYGGVFTITDIPEEAVRPVLLIECPRLLFPFARRIISDVTRDGGFPPLMVSPIDFADLYRRQFALQEQPVAGEA